MRVAFLLGFAAVLALRVGEARAQDSAMLDERVTQESVSDTICRPGYADTVAPPFDELMAQVRQIAPVVGRTMAGTRSTTGIEAVAKG